MKKVLVIGSSGFIGSHIIKSLGNKFEMYGIGTCNQNSNQDLKEYFSVDICDYEKIENIFNLVQPNIVIHLAAIVHKNNKDTSEKNYLRVNYEASRNIFQFCDKYKVEKVVFSSTIEVFGEHDETLTNLSTTSNPKSYYGKSKLLAENDLINSNYSFNYSILRFAPVYSSEFTLNIDKRIFLIKK